MFYQKIPKNTLNHFDHQKSLLLLWFMLVAKISMLLIQSKFLINSCFLLIQALEYSESLTVPI